MKPPQNPKNQTTSTRSAGKRGSSKPRTSKTEKRLLSKSMYGIIQAKERYNGTDGPPKSGTYQKD